MQVVWFAQCTKECYLEHKRVSLRVTAGEGLMTSVESIQSIRAACFGLPEAASCVDTGNEKPGSLADILLAIKEKRGALYMREMSGFLIEKWNLDTDRLDMQSSDTLDLVARLLKL
jgi:hypothetical protein